MNAIGRKALIGFSLLAVGTFVGAVWLGFGDLLPGVRPWLPFAMAASMVAGIGCLLFPRPKPYVSMLAEVSQDVVAALEGHRDQLERIAAIPERLGTSLEYIGERVGDLAHRLDRHASQLERLTMELVEAEQRRRTDPVDPKPPVGKSDHTSRPDLGHELKTAWKRYKKGGDGHFNAKGFKTELANGGIDVDVRSLDDHQAGHAVLVVDDPWASDRSFFVVPDFNKSPKSAEHWFEDESSRMLGGRIDELRKLARGKWSKDGPEILERGSVA